MTRALTLCPRCGVLAGELHKGDCPTQWSNPPEPRRQPTVMLATEAERESWNLEHGDSLIKVPLWKQALWLARHIEDIHSPHPDETPDDVLRGLTLVRVLGIGAEEHGDSVFHKSPAELLLDAREEDSDGAFYRLVAKYGHEIR